MIYLFTAFIALAATGLEAVSYPGFIRAHFLIPAIVLSLLSLAAAAVKPKNTFNPPRLLLALPVFATLVYLILTFAETVTYPNFVFTFFHLNLEAFQLFLALIWFHYLALSRKGFAQSLLIASLIFVSAEGAGKTAGFIYRNFRGIISAPFASYEAKMTQAYPAFYPAIQAVKDLTPPDSTVLIPPQGNPWEVEGNGALVNYFLYPRQVKNLDQTPEWSNLEGPVYIMIAKGSWPRSGATDYGWPKVPVQAKKIWRIDIVKGENIEYIRDYDPAADRWDWGLIEAVK